MGDRSFEEQVREELTGFKLKPDEEVWQNIELALREKKRRWLPWLFLFGGCVAGAFIIYNQFNNEQRATATGKIQVQKKIENQLVAPQINKQQKSEQPDKAIVTEKEIVNDRENNRDAVEKLIINKPSKEKTTSLQTLRIQSNDLKNNSRQIAESPVQEKPVAENISDNSKTNVDNKQGLNEATTKIADPITDQTSEHIESLKTDSSITPPNVAALPSTEKKNDNKKYLWQFALSAEMGNSGTGNLSSVGGNIPLFFSSASSSNFALAASNNIAYRADAFSFGFNMEANKKFSKRYGFSLSAGYELYQSRVGIGKRVDSTFIVNNSGQANNGGFFYTSADDKLYTNRYHFFQAAFSFYADYKIAHSVFLRWQFGMGTNLLISSNALQYSAANNILFQNRASLHKIQMDLSTGFDMGIGKEPKIYIGPHINYFLTPVSQQTGNTDQHLIRTAVKATFIIPGNKNKVQRLK